MRLAISNPKHNAKDWFVVVYGSYRNRSEAIAASEDTSKDIRDLNPWARSARGIQDDIKKANDTEFFCLR